MKNNIKTVSLTSKFSNINGIKNYSSEKYFSDGNIAKILKNNNGKKSIFYISPNKTSNYCNNSDFIDMFDKNINKSIASKKLLLNNNISNKNILYNQKFLKYLMIFIFVVLIFICIKLTYSKKLLINNGDNNQKILNNLKNYKYLIIFIVATIIFICIKL